MYDRHTTFYLENGSETSYYRAITVSNNKANLCYNS